MTANYQVFVSYAHADNESLDKGEPGWVSFFVDKLQRATARHPGGAHVEFWMDHRLEPQRQVTEELRKRIRDSVIILALISPRYMESKWCQLEMATFVAEVGGGVSAARVFMVEVLPTEREHWHTAVRDLSPVKLWVSDFSHPEAKTLGWPVPAVRGDRDYWDEVNTLASRLARQLGALAQTPPPEPPAPVSPEISAPASTPPLPEDTPLTVLINADQPDQSHAHETQAVLGELDVDGYLAPVMLAGQHPGEFRQAYESQLLASHGVIVVYGEAPPTWVQAKYGEARKVLALHRKGTWAGLLEAPLPNPEAGPKPPHGLPPRGLMVLDCKRGIDKAELARFVQALKAGGSSCAAGSQTGAGHV